MMDETHWREADRDAFAAPGMPRSPRCRSSPTADPHRHRPAAADLEAPAERVDARLSAPDRCRRAHHRPQGLAGLGRERRTTGTSTLTPDDAFAALMDGKTILDLAEGLQLRRARVMGANRIELSGFTDTMRERLRAYGLFTRSSRGSCASSSDRCQRARVLAKVLERYPIERIGEREAA
jgi:hypothetical protein